MWKRPGFVAVAMFALAWSACLIAESSAQAAGKIAKKGVVVVSAQQAKELLAQKDPPIVIDIRTEREFKKGHLEGAIMIDWRGGKFRQELAKLDPQKSYLFYCRSGGRSTSSLPIWQELGFQKVYHLDCGTLGWEKAKGKMVRGK